MPTPNRLVLLVMASQFTTVALAGDAFYRIPIRELKLLQGSLPVLKENAPVHYERWPALIPRVVLDGPGEGWVVGRGQEKDTWFSLFDTPFGEQVPTPPGAPTPGTQILVRAPQGKEVTGRLFLPNSDLTGMVSLPFVIPSSAATGEAREAFFRGKRATYEYLLSRDLPGGAWFRHQARLARAELNLPGEGPQRPNVGQPARSDEVTRTYDLFTGGRALSENLQLDRELPPLRTNVKLVKTDSLTGITIQEIDWKPLLKEARPRLDPLADKIPADQHVVFFPSFPATLVVADETKQHDTPLLRLAQPRSEDARVVERYQKQLGLPLSTIARLLGPQFARSVALTGSDFFFPTGTDLAVLFESPQPAILENLIRARIGLAAAQNKEAKPVQGDCQGLKYHGFLSPDRNFSSYVARLEGAVVVTNSLYQLDRLAGVSKGEMKSIAGLPEYHFFRLRYPLGDAGETALVFVSDATIRRWCGPRWRIGDSRRIRAAAVLAELQASQLDRLVRKTVKAGPIHTDLPILGGGELTLSPAGVASSTVGTLEFMTPIGELSLEEITQAEADAYRAWRDGYQRNWNWAFDPIAFRLGLAPEKMSGDLTVMPLIVGTEYREFLSLSQGGTFGPAAGDPHDSLAHVIFALNRHSPMLQTAENFLTGMGKAISLGWVGQSVSACIEEDPFWDDLAKVSEKDLQKFLEDNLRRIPVLVRADVSNPLKLVAFLTGARAYIEQTAPRLTRWESLTYRDLPYVRITATGNDGQIPKELANLAIYYTTIDQALTITLSEKVLHRTMDRFLARKKPGEKSMQKEVKPWVGSTVALRVDHKILEVANKIGADQYEDSMLAQCWGNLPILNEWKRLFPERDPVQVHKQVWGVELVCPGGGKYVWNEEFRTMGSTVYGHPGKPKKGPPAPPVLSSFSTASFGLTFENQGLRARVVLDRLPQVKK